MIQFALLLIQSGDKYEQVRDYTSAFFCKDNIPFAANALIKIQQHTLVDSNDPTNIIPRSYFIISETTGLELLRQTFAIDTFTTPASQIIQEQYLFKAILLLNASISHFEVDYEYTENGLIQEPSSNTPAVQTNSS